jgi:hypothetical protein
MKLPKWMEAIPSKEDGTYVVIARDHSWGRGATLQEACDNAKKAGGRSFSADNIIICWQPNSAWRAVKAHHEVTSPDHVQTDYLPIVGEVHGTPMCYGGHMETLYRPKKP